MQVRFYDIRWNERRESFTIYAQNLCSASLVFSNEVPADLLLNRLKAEVPTRLKVQTRLTTKSIDNVITTISRLSSAQFIRKHIREVELHPSQAAPEGFADGKEARYANYLCHFCGKRGHITRDCEYKRVQGKEKKGLQLFQAAALREYQPPLPHVFLKIFAVVKRREQKRNQRKVRWLPSWKSVICVVGLL